MDTGVKLLAGLALVLWLAVVFFRLYRKATGTLSALRQGPKAWTAAAPVLGLDVPQPGRLHLRGERQGRAVSIQADAMPEKPKTFDLTAPVGGGDISQYRTMKELWTRTEVAFREHHDQTPDLSHADVAQRAAVITDSGAELRALPTGLQTWRRGLLLTVEELERELSQLTELAAAMDSNIPAAPSPEKRAGAR